MKHLGRQLTELKACKDGRCWDDDRVGGGIGGEGGRMKGESS